MTQLDSQQTTGTDLATIDFDDFEAIARLTGQQTFDNERDFQFLRINALPKDKVGNKLIPGTFEVSAQGRGLIYAPTIKFRVMIRAMQYRRFSEKEKKVVSVSRIFTNWSDEAYDTAGGIRCGRPRLKKGEQPTPQQEAILKEAKTYMLLYGLATFETGITSVTGAEVKGPITVPCVMRVRGANYAVMSELIDNMTAKRRDLLRTEINFAVTQEVNGTAIWYKLAPTVDYTAAPVWNGQADVDALKVFTADIKAENEKVREQYLHALGKQGGQTIDAEASEIVEAVGGRNSFNDDFPVDDSDSPAFQETKVKGKKKAA